jgi:hypothetical protein
MPYFLEIRFGGAEQRWQRNPNAFQSWDEAQYSGDVFVATHKPDEKRVSEIYRMIGDPSFSLDNMLNVEYRIVEE